MAPPTKPRRRWKWVRRMGGALLLLVVALFALDAWLKSWPIKVIAPCDAEVTAVYGPVKLPTPEEYSRSHFDAWSRIGAYTPYDRRNSLHGDFSPMFTHWESEFHAGGSNHRVTADVWGGGKRVKYVQPSLQSAFYRAYKGRKEHEFVPLYDDLYIWYHDGFAVSKSQGWGDAELVEWDFARPPDFRDRARVVTLKDHKADSLLIIESYNDEHGRDRLWSLVSDEPRPMDFVPFTTRPVGGDVGVQFSAQGENLFTHLLNAIQSPFWCTYSENREFTTLLRRLQALWSYPMVEAVRHAPAETYAGYLVFDVQGKLNDFVMEFRGYSVEDFEATLTATNLRENSVDMEIAGHRAFAIPPSMHVGSIIATQVGDSILVGSSATALENVLGLGEFTESRGVACLHVDQKRLEPICGIGKPEGQFYLAQGERFATQQVVEAGPMKGTWLVFESENSSSDTLPPALLPKVPCGKAVTRVKPGEEDWSYEELGQQMPAALAEPYRKEGITRTVSETVSFSGVWPSEMYLLGKPLIEADRAYEIADAWTRPDWNWDGHYSSTDGGVLYTTTLNELSRVFASEVPLVTQSAWGILTSSEIYGSLTGGEATFFREITGQAMEDWSNFLVRWKRGPDAAPLSCIEESAGPGDVYPLLVVYLGLRAGADWFYPDGAGIPEAWQLRLDDLRTELLASLLQPGQCLTCPDLLMPIAESRGQLSPAALDALHRLPACPPPEREDYGVLPRCGS